MAPIKALLLSLGLLQASASSESQFHRRISVPKEGTVILGHSLPGHEETRLLLGSRREDVNAVYDDPDRCDDLPYYAGMSGVDAICYYGVENSNTYLIVFYYKNLQGEQATGGVDDIAARVRWSEPELDWETDEGVSIESALNDRESVATAYPTAEVLRNANTNVISRVYDMDLGIEVIWHDSSYGSLTTVSMSVHVPPSPISTTTSTTGSTTSSSTTTKTTTTAGTEANSGTTSTTTSTKSTPATTEDPCPGDGKKSKKCSRRRRVE